MLVLLFSRILFSIISTEPSSAKYTRCFYDNIHNSPRSLYPISSQREFPTSAQLEFPQLCSQ